MTAVRPPARFGGLVIDEGRVDRFTEKPVAGEGWINGGFLVFEPSVFDYLQDDSSLEASALERIAAEGQLSAYKHDGFLQCMDTLRDKNQLESLWQSQTAPWKSWGPIKPLRDFSYCPVNVGLHEASATAIQYCSLIERIQGWIQSQNRRRSPTTTTI